jgi:hypothetical protein
MSLLSCRDCGHNCSNRALACPACGRMIRGRAWWVATIGWGVIASALISFVLTALLFIAVRVWLPVF